MRDNLLIFGKLQPATKATRVYSADTLDMKYASNLGDVKALYAVFQLDADMVSGDTMTFELYDSSDNSSFVKCGESKAISGGKKGDKFTVAIPKSVGRYLKAGCLPGSTGTFTAQDVNAWLELC